MNTLPLPQIRDDLISYLSGDKEKTDISLDDLCAAVTKACLVHDQFVTALREIRAMARAGRTNGKLSFVGELDRITNAALAKAGLK